MNKHYKVNFIQLCINIDTIKLNCNINTINKLQLFQKSIMVRIDEIKVTGYKNIKSADLKLGNFNVIIGANNSGKSNFIQIISFLNYVINTGIDNLAKSFENNFQNTFFGEIIPQHDSIQKYDVTKNESEGTLKFELNFSNTKTNRTCNYKL